MNFLEAFRKIEQPAQSDLHTVNSDEQIVETVENREIYLRRQALQNSYVYTYIETLRELPGVKITGEDWCPEIHIRNEERQMCDVFSVIGKVNGYIQIGHDVLNPKILKDSELVEDAFERAYQNAISVEDSADHNHHLHIVY